MTHPSVADDEPAVRRGRPVGDQEGQRAKLLAAAISVIAEHGYAGASLRKVAERAGYSTGAVTYYFANKEGMIAAVAQDLFAKFTALIEPDREQFKVEGIIGRSLAWAQSDREMWLVFSQLLSHAGHEPAFAEVIQQLYRRFRAQFTSVLAKGQRQGTVRTDIPADILADQLSAISDGWMMLLPIEPERFKPERVKNLLSATLTLIAPQRKK